LKDEVGALYWSAAQYAQQNMAQRDMSKYGALLIFEFPRFKQDGTLVDDLENKANFIYDFQRFKPDGTAVDEAEGKANRSKELKETFYGSAYDKGLTPIADRIEKDGEKRCNAAIRSLDPDKDKKLIDATIDLCNERIVDAVDRAGQEVGQMIPKDIRFFTTVNDNIFIPRISIMIYNKTDFEPDTDPLGTRALYETLVEMGCLVDINGLNGECRMARSPKEPAEEKVTLK
jgi:hypothetical protein